MYMFELINALPQSVADNIIQFDDVVLKSGNTVLRITTGHVLSENEVAALNKLPFVTSAGHVARHRYAPEIRHGYFYVDVDDEEE